MTRHQLINASLSLLAALALALLLSASYLLDAPDRRGEWAKSTSLQDAQADAAQAERKQAAAQALCADERGPQSEARWTEDGDLVCTARRGLKSLQVAGGVL